MPQANVTLSVTPALITWQIRNFAGRIIVPQRIAVDFRTTVPSDSAFWRVYARGTFQNQTIFGRHYSYQQRGGLRAILGCHGGVLL